VDGFHMQKPSNLCKHGQQTLYGDDDDDDEINEYK